MQQQTPVSHYGHSLRERRAAAGLTQRELASQAGTSQQYLSLIERGAIDPRNDLRARLDGALERTQVAA